MQQINVQKIMEEIRAEIREKGYTADMLSFEDVPLSDESESSVGGGTVPDAVNRMRGMAYIAWRRSVNQGIKGIIKRVLYKLTGFVVAPITEDQTAFNIAAVSMAEQIYAIFEEQQKEIMQQKETIELLRKQISSVEKRDAKHRRSV